MLGVVGVFGWEWLFTTFHQVFFPQGNWEFSVRSSLIRLYPPQFWIDAAIAVAVILWYGGYSVVTGAITAGSLIAFLIYAINLSNPVKRLSQVYGNIQKALAAADRVFEILDI